MKKKKLSSCEKLQCILHIILAFIKNTFLGIVETFGETLSSIYLKGSRNWSADGNKRDAGHLHGSDDAQGCDGLQSWSQYCTKQLVGLYDMQSGQHS